MGGYYGPPQPSQEHPPPGYPPPAYGYPPPGYGYPPPGYGYPPPQFSWQRPPRVTPVRIGWALAATGLLMLIGGFLDWITGPAQNNVVHAALSRQQFSPNDNIIGVVVGVVVLIGALLIVLKQGRIWVGITGIVVAAFAVLAGVGEMGEIRDANNSLHGVFHVGVATGLIVYTIGALGALAATITATAVRRPRA
jgi:uncharacterized membrane protein